MTMNIKKSQKGRKGKSYQNHSLQFGNDWLIADQLREEQTLNSKRSNQDSINRVRVIQNNLLFINGLSSDLSSKELLETDLYFGRYGKVLKTIINPPQPFRKNVIYQAYVTYETEIDASLAIVALDGFKLSQRHLKASYGTTKYCSHFIKGYECPNSDCYYLHKIDAKREIINGDSKNIFKWQNNAAIDTVCNNLEEIINRSLKSPNENIFDGFPTLKQMLDFLIESNVLTSSQVQNTKEKIRTKPQNQSKSQKKLNLPVITEKTTKSSSLTAQTTSIQKIKNDKPNQENKIGQKQYYRQQTKSNQIKIDQKIEKLILKELLKGQKQCKSRFQFVQSQNQSKTQQINQIKCIFQKYLTVKN